MHGFRCIYPFLFSPTPSLLFSATPSHAANNWKSLIHEISRNREKLDPWNTFCTTKYPRVKTLYPRIIPKKKFRAHEIPIKKVFWSYKIPTKSRWYNGSRSTRRTMPYNSQNIELLSIFSNKFTLPV